LTSTSELETDFFMGRAWRIEYEGALYHILSRGNEQGDIFYDTTDRKRFLDTIGELSERFAVHIYAYVLMNNHYHLLLKTRRANLSKAMQWFGTTYTRRFNNRHNRSGHLFQGRFKSIIVENDAYLMHLSCYIHRNPLRAGIVKRLADYRWSSYLAYGYGKSKPDWLSTKLILSQFAHEDAHRQYRKKVQKYSKEEKRLWEDFRHGLFLGSKRFVTGLRKQHMAEKPDKEIPSQRQSAASLDPYKISGRASRLLGCNVEELKKMSRVSGPQKEKRDIIIYLIWQTGLLTNERIGAVFELTYSSVSHGVKAVKSKMANEDKFKDYIEDLNSQFKV
jgi:REP element-mobilizing transposase RayT